MIVRELINALHLCDQGALVVVGHGNRPKHIKIATPLVGEVTGAGRRTQCHDLS
jgi:hypothetical protein